MNENKFNVRVQVASKPSTILASLPGKSKAHSSASSSRSAKSKGKLDHDNNNNHNNKEQQNSNRARNFFHDYYARNSKEVRIEFKSADNHDATNAATANDDDDDTQDAQQLNYTSKLSFVPSSPWSPSARIKQYLSSSSSSNATSGSSFRPLPIRIETSSRNSNRINRSLDPMSTSSCLLLTSDDNVDNDTDVVATDATSSACVAIDAAVGCGELAAVAEVDVCSNESRRFSTGALSSSSPSSMSPTPSYLDHTHLSSTSSTNTHSYKNNNNNNNINNNNKSIATTVNVNSSDGDAHLSNSDLSIINRGVVQTLRKKFSTDDASSSSSSSSANVASVVANSSTTNAATTTTTTTIANISNNNNNNNNSATSFRAQSKYLQRLNNNINNNNNNNTSNENSEKKSLSTNNLFREFEMRSFKANVSTGNDDTKRHNGASDAAAAAAAAATKPDNSFTVPQLNKLAKTKSKSNNCLHELSADCSSSSSSQQPSRHHFAPTPSYKIRIINGYMTNENESSVFDNVDIKEKISKFMANKSEQQQKIKSKDPATIPSTKKPLAESSSNEQHEASFDAEKFDDRYRQIKQAFVSFVFFMFFFFNLIFIRYRSSVL